MENFEQINKRFNEIATTELFDISDPEARIHAMATDQQLVRAVYDEVIAQVEIAFPFFGTKTLEEHDKCFNDAKECVVRIAAHLQHEYGLSDEDASKAVELARLDIQIEKQIYD